MRRLAHRTTIGITLHFLKERIPDRPAPLDHLVAGGRIAIDRRDAKTGEGLFEIGNIKQREVKAVSVADQRSVKLRAPWQLV
jgi:hypothetical protein